jgi:hypothetical protein
MTGCSTTLRSKYTPTQRANIASNRQVEIGKIQNELKFSNRHQIGSLGAYKWYWDIPVEEVIREALAAEMLNVGYIIGPSEYVISCTINSWSSTLRGHAQLQAEFQIGINNSVVYNKQFNSDIYQWLTSDNQSITSEECIQQVRKCILRFINDSEAISILNGNIPDISPTSTQIARTIDLPSHKGEKISIALSGLSPRGVNKDEAEAIADFFRRELFHIGYFVVSDRATMEAALKQQNIQMEECFDQVCAIELGNMLNVSKVAFGSLIKLGQIYFLEVAVADVETGVLVAAEGEGMVCQQEDLPSLARAVARKIAFNILQEEE